MPYNTITLRSLLFCEKCGLIFDQPVPSDLLNYQPDATLPAPTPGTSAGMSVDAAATNNADYMLNFPAASDAVVEGAFVASMAEAFRKNGSGPTSTGTASVEALGNRWIIQIWGMPQNFPDPCTNHPLVLQNGANAQNMFSFAFFAKGPDPIPPPIFETFHRGLNRAADGNNNGNGNGRSNFEDHAAGYDPTTPTDPGLQHGIERNPERVITLKLPSSSLGEDFVIRWERSTNLVEFFSMVEGEDYQLSSSSPLNPSRNEITIELLEDTGTLPKQFFIPRYLRRTNLTAP